ncbi:hypothetical protein [Ornithinibacillus halophilus]|uniref:Uncharacterized protein n=1 Tax=Ornithinibacillus halophilus TaxID=930117 RepID=A0A1M5KN88_9BACI|nr:hypothetical protein [Ornithinibacillus halophilus]SHG54228.1 hypothetical protein SAMN05216225_10402 [Ornithinibacillus halophilus]
MNRYYKDYEKGVMAQMHHKNCNNETHTGNLNEVVDFRYSVLNPNVDNYKHPLGEDVLEEVATITFPELKKGDVVWLNGVVGLENDSGSKEADVEIRIFKGGSPIIEGQEIYSSDFDIDKADDEAVAPFSHVDVITKKQKNVEYVLVLKAEDPDMFLIGPLTFTGLQLSR